VADLAERFGREIKGLETERSEGIAGLLVGRYLDPR
jgi:hypothetical protein